MAESDVVSDGATAVGEEDVASDLGAARGVSPLVITERPGRRTPEGLPTCWIADCVEVGVDVDVDVDVDAGAGVRAGSGTRATKDRPHG